MTPFPMPQQAKLYKRIGAPTRDRSGQIADAVEHTTTAVTINNCLFYGFTGGRSDRARTDYSQTVAFYLPPGIDIDEGDIIRDVTGIDNFEPGPFIVDNVRYVTNLTGKVHHISCKLRGIVG